MTIDAGFVMNANPITIEELCGALKNLPANTVVERISRDEREDILGVSLEYVAIEAEPVIEIRLRLPKRQFQRHY